MKGTQEVLIFNLKALRQQRSWSQMRLSVESGVSSGMIGEIESGRKSPSLDTLDKLATAFGIQTYRLLFDSVNYNESELIRARKKEDIIKMITEL